MFKLLFLSFLVIPIVEIAILIQVAAVVGGWTTVLLVICTAFFGAKTVKQQGLKTYGQIQEKIALGQIPSEELFSGVCILISGVLLLTPGILTDILGFSLLTPAIRQVLITAIKQRINHHVFHQAQSQSNSQPNSGYFSFESRHFSSSETDADQHPLSNDAANDDQQHNAEIIEGEFKRKD